ncbi:hypothetical protein PCYB_004760, partial [Plasmodium cynomolgi strain B]
GSISHCKHAPKKEKAVSPFDDTSGGKGNDSIPEWRKKIQRYTGVQIYEEEDKDHRKKQPVDCPFPVSKSVIFEKNKVNKSEDPININYSNIASDLYPEKGFKTPNRKKHFSSDWEMLLAHNHGLYNFKNTDHNTIYLAIEYYKCLLTHSFHMNPDVSNQKCVKWFNEFMQCKLDEHKLNYGYNYIGNRRNKKSKAYIAAPDYQYS